MPGDLIDLDQIRTAECTNHTVVSCKSSPQTETCLKDWTLEVSATHPAISCISSPQTERCLNHCTTEATCFISPWNCQACIWSCQVFRHDSLSDSWSPVDKLANCPDRPVVHATFLWQIQRQDQTTCVGLCELSGKLIKNKSCLLSLPRSDRLNQQAKVCLTAWDPCGFHIPE